MNEQPVRNVAVIGLGQMGGGIARNLDRAGLLGAVWDPNPETMAPYSERGNVAVAPPANSGPRHRRCIGRTGNRVIFTGALQPASGQ